MAKKYVYYFGDGKAEGTSNMKELLGGKGAGLAEMTNLGISVPPGFTITTEACVEYYKLGKKYPPGMWDSALAALKRVERSMGMGFGDPERPLLVSVRSGARASMPGMMDTVLNVGLTLKTVEGLAAKTKNERFAQDSYRRFITMFGSIVMGVPREHFEAILNHKKEEMGVKHETQLDARALRDLVEQVAQGVPGLVGADPAVGVAVHGAARRQAEGERIGDRRGAEDPHEVVVAAALLLARDQRQARHQVLGDLGHRADDRLVVGGAVPDAARHRADEVGIVEKERDEPARHPGAVEGCEREADDPARRQHVEIGPDRVRQARGDRKSVM